MCSGSRQSAQSTGSWPNTGSLAGNAGALPSQFPTPAGSAMNKSATSAKPGASKTPSTATRSPSPATPAFFPDRFKGKVAIVTGAASRLGRDTRAAAGSRRCRSKHGVVGLTRNAAVEYGQYGVSINAIAPGAMMTTMVEHSLKQADEKNWEEVGRQFASVNPMKRFGDAHEVAALAAFLLSQEAPYINGAVITIDGGQSYKY